MRFLFVAALASASLFALACGSTVVNDDDGAGGSGDCGAPPPPGAGGYCAPSWECIDGEWVSIEPPCPEPECPASEPYNGVACVMEGQDCSYPYEWGCDEEPGEIIYRCVDGVFVALSDFCQPPPECPDELPIDGADCTGWDFAYDCYYDIDCGVDPAVANAWCDGSTWTWSVTMEATCGDCAYSDVASCQADAACRWLVPGCGENPLQAEGCYPAADCAPDSCGDGGTCSTYDADPCWDTLCNSCSAPVSVCEPIFQPNE